MTRFTVRRLTAAVILLAVLCAAAPASAAPAGRPVLPALGLSLLDPFFAWLGSFWLGSENQGQAAAEKGKAPLGGNGGTDPSRTVDDDRAGAVDPNG